MPLPDIISAILGRKPQDGTDNSPVPFYPSLGDGGDSPSPIWSPAQNSPTDNNGPSFYPGSQGEEAGESTPDNESGENYTISPAKMAAMDALGQPPDTAGMIDPRYSAPPTDNRPWQQQTAQPPDVLPLPPGAMNPNDYQPTGNLKPEAETDPRTKEQRLRLEGATPDKHWYTRMLRSALAGGLQGIATNGLGGGLGGAVTGALGGTFYPKMNTNIKTQMELAQNAPKVQYLDQQDAQAREQAKADAENALKQSQADFYKARPGIEADKNATRIQLAKIVGDHINQRADIKAGTAKPVINAKGQLELEFLNSDSKGQRKPNELLKGTDGQPITVPGEQGIEWTDPRTGRTEILKAKTAATVDATYQTNTERMKQQGDQFNQKMEFDKAKEGAMNAYKQAYLTLRQQEFQAKQTGDAKGSNAAALALAKFKTTLQMRVNNHQLTQADAEDILNAYANPGMDAEVGTGPPQP